MHARCPKKSLPEEAEIWPYLLTFVSTYLKLNHLAKNEETGQTRGQEKRVRRKKEAGKAGIKKSKVPPLYNSTSRSPARGGKYV